MSTDDKDTTTKDTAAPASPEAADTPGHEAPQVPADDTTLLADKLDEDGILKSDHHKRCIHCGKRSRMRVVKNADPVSSFSWPVRLLLKTFSPGGLELNKRYQCPRCGRNFNDMTVWEALIAPMMLIAFMAVLLLGFFWFVFVIVPAR